MITCFVKTYLFSDLPNIYIISDDEVFSRLAIKRVSFKILHMPTISHRRKKKGAVLVAPACW